MINDGHGLVLILAILFSIDFLINARETPYFQVLNHVLDLAHGYGLNIMVFGGGNDELLLFEHGVLHKNAKVIFPFGFGTNL